MKIALYYCARAVNRMQVNGLAVENVIKKEMNPTPSTESHTIVCVRFHVTSHYM